MDEDFRLEEWVVRPTRRLVERDGQSIHVKPKPMSVLLCLVAADGAPVSRTDLFETVWPGGIVSDETLTRCIAELRKAFGDTARDSMVIETIPKLGFRLVPPVEPLVNPPPSAPAGEPAEAAQPAPPGPVLSRQSTIILVAVVLILGVLALYEGPATPPLDTAEHVTTPRDLEQRPGIAVLPFVNMSSDSENEYFSDGISEEILNALANTDGLPVIARTSSFQFKEDNRDITEIGRLLGVTHILEGSVRKSGDTLRVSAQLIDATTGMHVWSDVYQREPTDIFVLQDELTQNIVDRISVILGDQLALTAESSSGPDGVPKRRTENLQAYDLYLKGMQMLASTNPGPISEAAGYFEKAIALDPQYADAWAAKGRSLYVLGLPNYGHSVIPATVYPEAIAAFKTALLINPRHAFAMGWMGVALMHNDFEWREGMRLLEQSLSLNPNDAALLSVYGSHLEAMQVEAAGEVQDRAFRLDPFGMVPITIRAFKLLLERRPKDGLDVLETSLIGNRQGYSPNKNAVFFNTTIGRMDAAETHIRQARLVAISPDIDLDFSQAVIDHLRGQTAFPWKELWERAPTERLSYLAFIGEAVGWESPQNGVKAIELAIQQRHPELYGLAFGPGPEGIPEEEWHRLQGLMGVTQFRQEPFHRSDGVY